MKCTYPEVCIYYHEIYDPHKKPNYKIICDYRDGEEIKNIPKEEFEKCKPKTFKEIKIKI